MFEVDVPPGFRYRPGFTSIDDETVLSEAIGRLEFSTFDMRGVVARRG